MPAVEGQLIGHYTILERIGEGGMGTVFKARDDRLGRTVALKLLSATKADDKTASRRFLREARAASALNHPNIVTVHELGEHQGADYIVMEYVSGKTLSECIGSRPMRLSTALKYAGQIADALTAAHDAGIVHCDLKPANVMVTASGLIKVLDFGLARVAFSGGGEATATLQTVTQKGSIAGTFPYMSPEQAEGHKLDARSDIFSFGAVLYEMITGRLAFEGTSNVATLAAVLRGQPKPIRQIVPDAPAALQDIVGRCLEKDCARRFQRAAEIKAALEGVERTSESSDSARKRDSQAGLSRRMAVLDQLGRILAAPEFARSDRGARFLRLIVERTLDDNAELLKESLLAIDAFGRPADFDPKADPVVRVEAIKLRRRLGDYYARFPNEPVRISIPKGHYVAEFHTTEEQAPPRRIVVLPVEDRQSRPENAWFAAGLTDELISALARVPGLLVVSRQRSASGATKDPHVAAAVRWDENRVRVTARLVDAEGSVLWSQNFDGAVEASISVQESIAASVAEQMGLKVPHTASMPKPVVPAAREWCLRGRFEMHTPSFGSVERARACFERAIALDPNFAAPYTQIARNILASAIQGRCLPDALLSEAQTFLARAMALDPDAPETHLARGVLLCRFLYQWEEGEESFRCALALDPAYADAHHSLAQECLLPQGRFQEAIEANQRAVELEPESRLFQVGLPWIRLFAEQFAQARAEIEKMLAEDPSFLFGQLAAGYFAFLTGKYERAMQLFEPFVTFFPMGAACQVACCVRTGQMDLAHSIRTRALSGEITPAIVARMDFALGDTEAAIRNLHRAIDMHDLGAAYLAIDPLFRPMRGSSAFEELLERMSLQAVHT